MKKTQAQVGGVNKKDTSFAFGNKIAKGLYHSAK